MQKYVTIALLACSASVHADDSYKISQCHDTYAMLGSKAEKIEFLAGPRQKHPEPARNNSNVGYKRTAGKASGQAQDYVQVETYVNKLQADPTELLSAKTPVPVNPKYRYFDLKPDMALSQRTYVDPNSGRIYFQMKAGSLKENLESLVADTRGTQHLLWCVSRSHEVYSDYMVSGESMTDVVNNIVKPYAKPEQIYVGLLEGSAVAIHYESDKELDRCD